MRPTQPRLSPLALIALALLVALSGCELTAVGESEQIANVQTVVAGTPSATVTATNTTTAEPTATLTPTLGPSPTPSNTPSPTITPLPPTPTTNPALTGFSLCDQQVGDTQGLFSARLATAQASGTPAFEQLVLRFELGAGSGPIGATASCVRAASLDPQLAASASGYVLRLGLPGWIRDERFSSSAITGTLSLTGTRTITAARLVPSSASDAGAELLIDLAEPLPFRLSLESNPARIVLSVARQSAFVSTSNALAVQGGSPALPQPLYTIFDGDIWRVAAGANAGPGLTAGLAGATNLTTSPETETAFDVSPDGATIAFCRAAPGLDPADAELPVPSALWIMGADGGNLRLLAQAGVSCADPAFSLDGATVAFAVDETGATPVQRTIYSVPAAGGTPQRLLQGVDEWSRFGPQWLRGGALAFAGSAQDGRSTLFVRGSDGQVRDVGADLLIRNAAGLNYVGLGRPLAAPDGSRMAVELLRDDGAGADLAILGADGALLEILGGQRELAPATAPTAASAPTGTTTSTAEPSATVAGTPGTTGTPAATAAGTPAATTPTAGTPAAGSTARATTATTAVTAAATAATTAATTATPAGTATPTLTATIAPTAEPTAPPVARREGPYWTRPLAWDSQGRLIYLTTRCPSEVLQDYQIQRWSGAQRSELLLTGQTLGGIGQAVLIGENALAYVLTEQAPAGPRGPSATAPRSPSALWIWDIAGGGRAALLNAERDLNGLAR